MIIGKKKKQETSVQETKTEQIQIPKNGLIAVYHAIKEILEQVRWDYYDTSSEKIFKTVSMNRGQFERIVRKGGNLEYALGFPAAFIEFTNWHYLVQQQRINEGRAFMQIKFIMNRLNNQDADVINSDGTVDEHRETEVEYVAQIINQFIQELKYKYSALSERVNLKYIDPLESFDNSLQPCWITYEVWFKEESINVTRQVKEVYLVFPPYTNHSDQTPEHNVLGHSNYDHLERHNDHSKFIIPTDINGTTGDELSDYDPMFDYDGKTDILPGENLNNDRLTEEETGDLLTPAGIHPGDELYEDYLYLLNRNVEEEEEQDEGI